jgi:hypothetical protein
MEKDKMAGNRTRRPRRRGGWQCPASVGLSLVFLLALAGCTYRGDIDQSVTLKFTWFSYLNGDDIRQVCAPGAPDSFRLVYNGSYNEQLRSYEIVGDGGGGGHYTARVMRGGGIRLSQFSVRNPQAVAGWTVSRLLLVPGGMANLTAALADSGAFAGAPTGLRMASEQFYWIAAACRGGVFYSNAWLFPSERFNRLTFPEMLFEADQTGLAVNPPRDIPPIERGGSTTGRGDRDLHFDLEVGNNGLVAGPSF